MKKTLLSRESFIKNARQVAVEGVADSVAVGYVQELMPGKVSYLVFFGKQSAPAKYFGSPSPEHAEQQVIKWLNYAADNARRKAEERQQAQQMRQPYTEYQSEGVTVRSYSTAGTAQLIRQALKKAFPGVKFSVLSSVYANGSSVDVTYTDGPSVAQVKEVTDTFNSGSYNSMEDIYESNQARYVVDSDSGQRVRTSYGAKYISNHRQYSAAYGSFLNKLDLRQQPGLPEQFEAFYDWHCRQLYNTQASYGQNEGIYTLDTNGNYRDLERFATALTEQGYLVSVGQQGGLTQLSALPATDTQSPPAQLQPQLQPQLDQTDLEFEAAERSWLA